MLPALNWREIARYAELASQALVGTHVDRVFIAERAVFPEGYLKSEWFIRLGDRKRDAVLAFSVRARSCYLMVQEGKGPRASTLATRSPFDQALSKHIKGQRLTAIRALERERYVVLEFGADYWLVLALIPALPEALLWDVRNGIVLARTRNTSEPWKWPSSTRAAPEVELRETWVQSLESWSAVVEGALREDASGRRRERALREIREKVKALRSRVQQSEQELERARGESDWQTLGETLKQWLYALPEPKLAHWDLGGIQVPCGEGRTPSDQMEKLFGLARRKKRRIEEASGRLEVARQRLALLEPWLEKTDLELSGLERAAGISMVTPSARGGLPAKGGGVPSKWTGRTYFSKDGVPLLVGRSSAENLELTFKIARGNDLWMHVRGKPGAHLVIPLAAGKSASLETLLDAAQLVIFHSGGRNWGKTEVDYTFKKYVKRIRDSTEASYVQNKTLIVAPETARLDRLLAQQQGEQRSN